MQPDKYEQRYKSYLKARKELEEIEEKLKNLPYIPYDKPVQHGWWLTYEMRKDISNRDDSHWIQKAIDVAYKPQHIRNVKHVRMMRAGLKGYWGIGRNGRRVWISFAPYTVWLKEREYDKLPPQVKKYFKRDRWNINPYYRDKYSVDLPSYWLVPKARPRFFTHYQAKGGPLEKRKAFLEDMLDTFWREYGYNYHKSYPAHKDRTKTRDQIQKFKKGEISDIIVEKIPLEYQF